MKKLLILTMLLLFTGNNLFSQESEPEPVITNKVTDSKTKLIWQKCSRNQTDSTACTGNGTPAATWSAALLYCRSVAGGGWRLPNRNELKSLVDFTKSSGPTINTTLYPNTVSGNYWTSSTYAPITGDAYIINFTNGTLSKQVKTNTAHVRCVSGP